MKKINFDTNTILLIVLSIFVVLFFFKKNKSEVVVSYAQSKILEEKITKFDEKLIKLSADNGSLLEELKENKQLLYNLKQENVKLKNVMSTISFNIKQTGTDTLHFVKEVKLTDTIYIDSLPVIVDSTYKVYYFNDKYLKQDIFISEKNSYVQYEYNPGKIDIAIYAKKKFMMKPKYESIMVFENKNTTVTNANINVKVKQPKLVLGVSLGYGIAYYNNKIIMAPSLQLTLTKPFLYIY